MSLPGKPTVVAVKDDKYATVAVVTNGTDVGGKIVRGGSDATFVAPKTRIPIHFEKGLVSVTLSYP